MSDKSNLNERGNHQGEFTQGVGGWAEYTVNMTETLDKSRHDITVPPGKVIPVIFLPGVLGSNLRMTKQRQGELKRPDNRSWRPDDLVNVSGEYEVVRATGMGGWFRNASPAQRQLDFDPENTEVEYYHYTTSKERFDPDGKETRESDARHQNVPDSLGPIPPLMGYRLTQLRPAPAPSTSTPRRRQMPAQIARWRGWSEYFLRALTGICYRQPKCSSIIWSLKAKCMQCGDRCLPTQKALAPHQRLRSPKPILRKYATAGTLSTQWDITFYGAMASQPL